MEEARTDVVHWLVEQSTGIEDRCLPQNEAPTCEERCGRLGRRVTRECLSNGGDEQRCYSAGRRTASACMNRCEGETPEEPQEPDEPEAQSRQERCVAGTRARVTACIESGRDAAACRNHYAGPMRTCLESCSNEGHAPEDEQDEEDAVLPPAMC